MAKAKASAAPASAPAVAGVGADEAAALAAAAQAAANLAAASSSQAALDAGTGSGEGAAASGDQGGDGGDEPKGDAAAGEGDSLVVEQAKKFDYPRTLRVRNNGNFVLTEPLSGKLFAPGGTEYVTLRDSDHEDEFAESLQNEIEKHYLDPKSFDFELV